MNNDIRIGRLFGIEIYISYSWFFIFFLVTFSLAFGLFPQEFPRHSRTANILIGMFASALFFGSLLFHEMTHSVIANRNHIPIHKITLFIFGGMSQMTEEPAKPLPELKMAAAGPVSSFFLAAFFFLVYRTMVTLGLDSELFAAFRWLAQINLLLALFNLAPGFPLDGGRVLRAAVWYLTDDYERATTVATMAGQGVAFLLIGLGLTLFLFGGIGGVWLILIGWFLYQSALGSSRQLILQHTLSNVKVRDIMSTEVLTVSPETNLEDLVNFNFLRHRFGRFPVVQDGALLGIVTLHDVKDVERSRWGVTRVGDIIEPTPESMLVSGEIPAFKALLTMAGEDIGHLLVVDKQGKLLGIVTRTDIFNVVRIRGELEI